MITAAKIIGVLEYAEALARRYGFDSVQPHIDAATRAVVLEVRKRNLIELKKRARIEAKEKERKR